MKYKFKNDDELREYVDDTFEEDIVYFPGYSKDVIGMSHDSRLIYSFDNLIRVIGGEYIEAVAEIEQNLMAQIPYLGEHAPIIMYDVGYGN